MNNILRLLVTAGIWVLMTGLAILSIAIPDGITSGSVMIILMSLGFAHATTRSLWGLDKENKEEDDALSQRREMLGEKRKRGAGDTKAEMLLALMDDDEREAFKLALQEQMLRGASRLSDGEIMDEEIPLSDLLNRDEQQY